MLSTPCPVLLMPSFYLHIFQSVECSFITPTLEDLQPVAYSDLSVPPTQFAISGHSLRDVK